MCVIMRAHARMFEAVDERIPRAANEQQQQQQRSPSLHNTTREHRHLRAGQPERSHVTPSDVIRQRLTSADTDDPIDCPTGDL